MIYIIAGNAKQANDYVRRKGLSRPEYCYVSNVSKMQGVARGCQVKFVGTWYDRSDAEELREWAFETILSC